MTGRVFVVHGYQAAPERHWFPWLAGQLAADGFAVTVVALPDSDTPQVGAWSKALAAAVGEVDAQTWFVGHSLGCITVMRYLAELPDSWSAAGVVLVAGFAGPLTAVPELWYFLADELDAQSAGKVAERVPVRRMIRSDNDPFVPPEASDALAAALDAPVLVVPGAGHFMGSDGITEFPQVRELIAGRG